jgi:iron complex outermembrane recepter protein
MALLTQYSSPNGSVGHLSSRQPLALLITLLSLSITAQAADTTNQPEADDIMVVTSPQMQDPLTVLTDPKAPRQPLPAQDGADLLKSIPGFAVTRKGGTDGDPLFRGMAASRLGILLDGEMILGGCGMRMDPPTAYIFPESYDQVRVLKGPQSVKYGPGTSAGVVLFERDDPVFGKPELRGEASVLAGSADRSDLMASLVGGDTRGYLKADLTSADANNYEDGDGNAVHSAYSRASGDVTLGWTPGDNTRVELSAGYSDGEARYADRSMDGAQFERKNVGLRLVQSDISPLVSQLEARIYQNNIDHVMDNYSLRSNSGMRMVSNPDRATDGASITSKLVFENSQLELGTDWQKNQHRNRSASAMGVTPDYESLSRTADMEFETWGIYAEYSRDLQQGAGLYSGLRINQDSATDLRSGKDSSGDHDRRQLTSAYLRYEQPMGASHRWYAGIGHSERAADYWERSKTPAATSMMMSGSASTFNLDPEKTTQIDLGMLHHGYHTKGSVSAFYARHADYILIETLPAVSSYASNARNISATTFGTEADASWQFAQGWNSSATLAWVHGRNNTEKQALGQIPAMEGRLGLDYDTGSWATGAVWRLVADQKRSAPGSGNIVGQDIGDSGGFNVFSINASYRLSKNSKISAGIDNLFDITYAEHISRGGAIISGYNTTTRVNEPGRTLWLKGYTRF